MSALTLGELKQRQAVVLNARFAASEERRRHTTGRTREQHIEWSWIEIACRRESVRMHRAIKRLQRATS